MNLMKSRVVKAEPWLQKIFKKAYPYPMLLSEDIQRETFNFSKTLPHAARYRCTWRGGGFRDEYKSFFESMMGQYYRVPGFLATSMAKMTAMDFIRSRDINYPRVLWCILLDERGKYEKEFQCRHANFVFKTEVLGEMEFLYAAYSVFKVVRIDFAEQDWSQKCSHYTIVVQAAIDNVSHAEDLPL